MTAPRGGRKRDRSGHPATIEPAPRGEPTEKVGPNRLRRLVSAVLLGLGPWARRFEFTAGTIGFLIGIAVMTWRSLPLLPGSDPRSVEFLRAPEAMVWVFLVAGEVGFWFSALPFQWRWRSDVKDAFRLQPSREIRGKHLLAVVMFVVPAALMSQFLPRTVLVYHREKVMIVNLLAVLAAVVSVEGIWYVKAALDGLGLETKIALDDAPHDKDKERVGTYLALRESLQRFITFLGAMISLGTLAKGGYRHAFIATGGSAKDFPPEYILLHGAYFTGLLALVYVPTYTRLAAAGSAILESVFPVTAPDVELRELSQWQSNRKSLEDLLQLHVTAADNLRASVTILAPLASGTLSVLLGDKLLLGN